MGLKNGLWIIWEKHLSFEDGIKRFLENAEMKCSDYRKWLEDGRGKLVLGKSADVGAVTNLDKIKKLAKPQQCTYNSWIVAHNCPNTKYHEGLIWIKGYPESGFNCVALHAWSSLDGTHFDLTSELPEGLRPDGEYFELFGAEYDQLSQVKSKIDHNFKDCSYEFYQAFKKAVD